MAVMGNGWVNLASKKLFLVKNGNECTTVTGGWATNGRPYSSNQSYVGNKPTKNGMRITQPSSSTTGYGWSGSVATNNAVDLSEYNKLTIEFDVTTTGTVADYIRSNITFFYAASLPTYQTQATYVERDYAAEVTANGETLSVTFPLGSIGNTIVGIGVNNKFSSIAITANIKNVYASKE